MFLDHFDELFYCFFCVEPLFNDMDSAITCIDFIKYDRVLFFSQILYTEPSGKVSIVEI